MELKHLLRSSHRVKPPADLDKSMTPMESISKMLNRLTECVLRDVR